MICFSFVIFILTITIYIEFFHTMTTSCSNMNCITHYIYKADVSTYVQKLLFYIHVRRIDGYDFWVNRDSDRLFAINNTPEVGFSAAHKPTLIAKPPPPFGKISHIFFNLFIIIISIKPPFTCKNSSASGGFAPWTPTRALQWAYWELQSSPPDPMPSTAPPPFGIPGSAPGLGTWMLKTNSELSGTCFDMMIYLDLRAFYVW